MQTSDETTEQQAANLLVGFYRQILAEPTLLKGTNCREDWPWWRSSTDEPVLNKLGVYILWPSEGGHRDGRPFYVGQGIIGVRISSHFYERPQWTHAQVLSNEHLTAECNIGKYWRVLLESFLTLILRPTFAASEIAIYNGISSAAVRNTKRLVLPECAIPQFAEFE
jgi:hypothetical protein